MEPAYSGDLRLLDVERDAGRGMRIMPDDETLAAYRKGDFARATTPALNVAEAAR